MTTTDPAPASTGLAPETLGAHLQDRLEEAVRDVTVRYNQLTVTVAPEALVDAARICKEDPALAFDFWEFNSAIDQGEDGFALVTNLYSTTHRHRISLRVDVPGGREDPVVSSLTDVYRGANWSERETYDMFGIRFEGHPGLEPRILSVETFEGWPLRKDFLLSTREAKPWPGAKEPKEHDTDEGQAPAITPSEEPVSAEDKAAAAKAKAERAKKKAAEMRARKAAERAAAAGEAPAAAAAGAADTEETTPEDAPLADTAGESGGDAGEQGDDSARPSGAEFSQERTVPGAAGEGAPEEEAEGARAAAAAAAGEPTPAGTPDPTTPEGGAEIAGSPVAKDAAAGAVQGATGEGAPSDAPLIEHPHEQPEREAKAGEGAAPAASGAPGIEAEGRHGGAEQQSWKKPAAETPGMDAEQREEAARPGDATRAALEHEEDIEVRHDRGQVDMNAEQRGETSEPEVVEESSGRAGSMAHDEPAVQDTDAERREEGNP